MKPPIRQAARDGIQEHLLRVDGLLLALETELTPPEERTSTFTRADVPAPPEQARPEPFDPLTQLIRRFDLDQDEADLLRLAAAAEVSPAIATTLSGFQGDRRFRRPQVNFAMRTLDPDPARQLALLRLLEPSAPLRRHRLLELTPPWRDRVPLFTELELAIPAGLLFHLAGVRAADPQYAAWMKLEAPGSKREDLVLPEEVSSILDALEAFGPGPGFPYFHVGPPDAKRLTLFLHAPYGSGKRSVSHVLANAWGLDVLEIDWRTRPVEDWLSDDWISVLKREARRLGALPVILHGEHLFDRSSGAEQTPIDPASLERLLVQLDDFEGPLLFCSQTPPPVVPAWYRRRLVLLDLELPVDTGLRTKLWYRTLAADGRSISAKDPEKVFKQYPFTPGEMRDAIRAASSFAAGRDLASSELTLEELQRGCVSQLRHNLESLSQKSKHRYAWDDLILPDGIKSQLRMLQGFIHNRDMVYEQWGLGRRVMVGRGVKSLFYGPSGTGKTMGASVIACNLGIDLFKVDLSLLVSKWVGETEKNIDRIFTEAQKSHAIILFDEADSLFGKRGSVERGTDRYSNMEINYLLQRFEEYDGTVILTSNYPRGIDEAFSRRMHFVIEFPMPDEEMRRQLWASLLPPELPLADDVDIERLVVRFELSGGNIQNIILGAAFLAAEDGRPVTMLDIMRAVQLEYQKIGKTISRSEFEEFFDRLL